MNKLTIFLDFMYASAFVYGLIEIIRGNMGSGLYLCIGSILLVLFNYSVDKKFAVHAVSEPGVKE